jgi:hypothetical protein
MATDGSAGTHDWSVREIIISKVRFEHRHCAKCGRDLARTSNERQWQATYLGALQFHFLNRDVTERWIAEPCPGRHLPEDANDLRMRWKA